MTTVSNNNNKIRTSLLEIFLEPMSDIYFLGASFYVALLSSDPMTSCRVSVLDCKDSFRILNNEFNIELD